MIQQHVDDVCKIGQGKACCRYLLLGKTGFECGKLTSLKSTLDYRVKINLIVAQADNCEGIENNNK